MMIDKFQGKNRFLSNFYPCFILIEPTGLFYPSVEHAYQAAKTLDNDVREKIRTCETPGQAKRLGKYVRLRPDWEQVKLSIMEYMLRQKFHYDDLKSMLLNTGNQVLVEGNTWGDTYWGVCNDIGQNNLGKLLMKIRNEIKNEQ